MPWLRNKIFRWILFGVVLIATLYFLYLIREVVLSFLIAGLLAYFLYRPVLSLESKGLNRSAAILILYVLLIFVVTVALWFSVPKLINELSGVAMMLPQYAQEFDELIKQIDGMQLPGKFDQIVTDTADRFENSIYDTVENVIMVIYNLLSKIFIVIFAPIMAFYILKDWEQIKLGLGALLPPVTSKELAVVAKKIDDVIIEFAKGYLMIAMIIGLLVSITAALLGVKYALLLGIIAGLGELIPYFGPIMAGIPAVAVALSKSTLTGLYMLVAIVIIQQLESNIITPRLMGERVGMHPLLMVFALLAGGKLMGIGGMLIAVPLAASLKIMGYYLYLKIIEP